MVRQAAMKLIYGIFLEVILKQNESSRWKGVACLQFSRQRENTVAWTFSAVSLMSSSTSICSNYSLQHIEPCCTCHFYSLFKCQMLFSFFTLTGKSSACNVRHISGCQGKCQKHTRFFFSCSSIFSVFFYFLLFLKQQPYFLIFFLLTFAQRHIFADLVSCMPH